jgi:nickel transport protein
MIRLLAVALALLASANPAMAHRLKLFLTVEGTTVTGYAFFVGGGRPQGVAVIVKDGANAEVFRGTTDEAGAFAWTAPRAADYTLGIDTGDGHMVEERIAASRFAGSATPAATPAPPPPAPPPAAAPPAPPPETAAATAPAPPACTPDAATLGALVEAATERALARQLRPLIEAQTAAESRLRVADIVAGVGMIVGLAGAWMWALARRRPERKT